MGYPMTFRRVLNRNRINTGDYQGELPSPWGINLNLDNEMLAPRDVFVQTIHPHLVERIKLYETNVRSLLGDLRRLEQDAIDENCLCKEISRQTGLNVDDVAAVLKAFIEI